MTVQQYEEYKAKMNRLEPVKVFLFWCGERYRGKSVSKHHFRIKTIKQSFLLHIHSYLVESYDYEIPEDLQERIVKTIEEYVDEKERELEQI